MGVQRLLSRRGDEESLLHKYLDSSKEASITLAGGGPGSAGLLTLAAYAALQRAVVVIRASIAPPELRAVRPPHPEFYGAAQVPRNADRAQGVVNGLRLVALRRG